MNERELLADCLRRLNRVGVTYYLTGSMASNYWGIPRTTHDLDFVIQLPPSVVPRIVQAFSGDYHIDEAAVRAAYQPPHVSAADIAALTRYVEQGGGLIVMGNQENHNLEIDDMNKLLLRFGLQFTNLYTDAKKLVLPKETPIIGGLRWGYYTGNLVLITPDHPARPRPLVLNDLKQKPRNGPRDTPGALLAVAEPGRGHVVVVTDSGWLLEDALNEKGIGGVVVKGQDNWEIFRHLAHWAAGTSTE